MHLRTGDDIYNRGLGNKKTKEIIINKLNKLKQPKQILIVTALHYGHCENISNSLYKSTKYSFKQKNYEENIKVILSFIEEIAQKTHHTVKDIISNSSVDIDLLLLVFSKHLVTSEVSGKFAIQVQTLHNEYHKELN